MSPAVTAAIKALPPFVMLYPDEWKRRNLLTNYCPCCLALFPLPSASQIDISCLSKAIESLVQRISVRWPVSSQEHCNS